MKLNHYEVTITENGEPHEIGGGVDAPSALGALVQVAEDAFTQPDRTEPVLVLDKDSDELREFRGCVFKKPKADPA